MSAAEPAPWTERPDGDGLTLELDVVPEAGMRRLITAFAVPVFVVMIALAASMLSDLSGLTGWVGAAILLAALLVAARVFLREHADLGGGVERIAIDASSVQTERSNGRWLRRRRRVQRRDLVSIGVDPYEGTRVLVTPGRVSARAPGATGRAAGSVRLIALSSEIGVGVRLRQAEAQRLAERLRGLLGLPADTDVAPRFVKP